jgi:hypothetical protein
MKSPIKNNIQTRNLVTGLTLLIASPAFAVIPFSFTTDGSSVITGGTWSGDGTVQPNIVMGTAPGPVQLPVTDFTSGTLALNSMGGNDSGNVYSTNRILTNPLTSTHVINLTGGSADLRMHNSNNNDGGTLLFNSLGLTNFDGVTSISWTTTYNQPIAGRNTDLPPHPSGFITRPMGMGLAMVTAGTGQTISSFTVDMSYTQIYQQISPGVFITGVPSIATPTHNAGFGTQVAGATSFTSDAFTGLNQFLLVRGYNMDGIGNSGNMETADADDVYMRQMTWTIRKDDNSAFASDTVFVFSMDGQQYSNFNNVIPEPSSMLLLSASLLGGCLYRRRTV